MRAIPAWLASAAAALTRRRIRGHALILALCLWGVCAVDYATPGAFDRAGNIKFQDFLPLYVSARMIEQHRAAELYDPEVMAQEIQTIVHQPSVRLPNLYGPQVGLLFVPLASLPFPSAARIWIALSLILYVACVVLIWRCCPNLRGDLWLILLAAAAYPPLFHFFVRGQTSVLALLCFTVAFVALRKNRPWLAGILLGFLLFKPQFLLALPLIFLLAQAWRIFGGLVISAAAQWLLTWAYFGSMVIRAYIQMLSHASRWIEAAELNLAPIQMHSLRAFWALLIPLPSAAFSLYVLTSILAIWIASRVWKSSAPLSIRFSVLLFTVVLVNPHIFIYDLLVLVPAFLLLSNWLLTDPGVASSSSVTVLIYLAFVLPLIGPLARWTHLQLSVIIFIALLWSLFRIATAGHKLALRESDDV